MISILRIALFLLFPMTVAAGPVSEGEARQRAVAFMQQRGKAPEMTAAGLHVLKVRHAPGVAGSDAPASGSDTPVAGSDAPGYYIYNVADGAGFVIVSGDDRTVPILGYADSGSIDENDLPDGLRYLLDGYAEQLAWLDETGVCSDGAYHCADRAAATRSAIAPLIATRWNQGKPYNALCPEIDGEKTVTGCVATSMAQLMYYHQWPQTALPAIPGYTFTTKDKDKSSFQLTVDPLEATTTTFDWEDMTTTYTSAATGAAADAVAMLMQYCGVSLQMHYGLSANGGSSAFNVSIAEGLKTYFGYDGTTTYMQRHHYSYVEWVALIYNELASGRPVVLGGQSIGGGHSFVCDGYDTDDYFHINWGWGGSDDGYFRLSLLNPYEQGIGGSSTLDGFTYSQDAVIGIKPFAGTSTAARLALERMQFDAAGSTSTLTVSRTAAEEAFTVSSLYVRVCSYQFGTNNFDVAVILTDADGNAIGTAMAEFANQSLQFNKDGIMSLTDLSTPEALTDGTYYIKVMSRATGATEWQECYDGASQQMTAIVSGNTMTINAPFVSGSDNLPSVADITVSGNLTQGYEQEVTASMTAGASDYHGTILLRVDGSSVMGKAVDIPAGQTVDAHFTFIPATAGEHTLTLYARNEQKQIGSSATVTIGASDATDDLDLTFAATIDNQTAGGMLYGNALRATVTVSNASTTNSYAGRMNCSVRKWTSTDNGDGTTTWAWESIGVTHYPLVVDKESSTVVEIARDGLETGVLYSARITYQRSSATGKVADGIHLGLVYEGEGDTEGHGTLDVTNGYSIGTATGTTTIYEPAQTISAGDACFVDLRNIGSLDGLTVNSGTNPNCLYLLPENASVPASLSGCNVVCGTEATTLTLTDGYDFYTPIAFTAANAAYTRTFTLAAAGSSGWNTLVVPFDVTTVKVLSGSTEKTVDWFRSDTDEGKNFWLKGFTGDGQATVTFDYAQSIEANTPYIIAVPDDRFGAEWQMTGKPVIFSGTGVTIDATKTNGVSGNYFKFSGNTTGLSLSDVYVLNTNGSRFVKAATATDVPAFRAWFSPVSISSLARSSLSIASPDVTGIDDAITLHPGEWSNDKSQTSTLNSQTLWWYSLDGRRLAGKPATPGIYIKNGRKVAITETK